MTTYYVDFTAGNDANSGESELLPWKYAPTMASASGVSNSTALASGDILLFKKGETWTERLLITSTNVIYDAYGTGALPIIDKRATVTEWDAGVSPWSDEGGNKWSMSLTAIGTDVLGRCWINGTEALKAENLAAITSTYNFSIDTTGDGELLVYSVGDPAVTFSSLKVSNIESGTPQAVMFHTSSAYDNTIRNLDIRGGTIAVRSTSTAGDGNIIENCIIGTHSVVGVAIQGGNDGIIRNCTIASGFVGVYTHQNANSASDGIQTGLSSVTMAGWQVYINTFTGWGHTAISLSTSGTGSISDIKIYSNDISAANISSGRAIGISRTSGSVCTDIEIYNNDIHNINFRNQLDGDNIGFYNNLVRDIPNTLAGLDWSDVDSAIGQGITIAAGSTDIISIRLLSNTFVNISEEAIEFVGTNDISGCFVENNICYNCGEDSHNNANPFSMTIADVAGISNITFRNNLCFDSVRGLGADEISYRATGAMTVAEFEAAVKAGSDGDIASNNLNADPLFLDASNDNYNIQTGSPCRLAGIDVGISTDFASNPVNTPPDIGALQFVSGGKVIDVYGAAIVGASDLKTYLYKGKYIFNKLSGLYEDSTGIAAGTIDIKYELPTEAIPHIDNPIGYKITMPDLLPIGKHDLVYLDGLVYAGGLRVLVKSNPEVIDITNKDSE